MSISLSMSVAMRLNTNASLKRFLISCAVDKNALKLKRANRSEAKQTIKKWVKKERRKERKWTDKKIRTRHWDQDRHRLMVCTWSVHKTKSSHKLIIWEFINLKRRHGIMCMYVCMGDLKPTTDRVNRDDRQSKLADRKRSSWQ